MVLLTRGGILRWTLAFMLIVAAAVKCLDIYARVGDGNVHSPDWSEALLGLLEFVLGLLLLSGRWVRFTSAVTLVIFIGFAVVSLSKVVSSKVSCGCFGGRTVSPWLTMAFDFGAVFGTLLCYPIKRAEPRDTTRSTLFSLMLVWPVVATVLALGLSITVTLLRSQPIILSNLRGPDAKPYEVLEPGRWVGNSFPIASYIDIGSQLLVGNWIVVLHRRDCPACRRAIAHYMAVAQKAHLAGEELRVAFIELPPHASETNDPSAYSSACVLGELSDSKEWVVSTPVVIELGDGRVRGLLNSD